MFDDCDDDVDDCVSDDCDDTWARTLLLSLFKAREIATESKTSVNILVSRLYNFYYLKLFYNQLSFIVNVLYHNLE